MLLCKKSGDYFLFLKKIFQLHPVYVHIYVLSDVINGSLRKMMIFYLINVLSALVAPFVVKTFHSQSV